MANPYVEAYGNKKILFRYRNRNYSFALSHGLFSSGDIDIGSRFLLKILSQILDADMAASVPLPRRILDAGCGIGVLGICAAGAIAGVYVRAQDRDELARQFTIHNAETNGLDPLAFEVYTEPLLSAEHLPAAESGDNWDLILTNIPAKAGKPVLQDFISRSAKMLAPSGRVIMVAVNTLADFFRIQITENNLYLISETRGAGHTVFVYGQAQSAQSDTAEKAACAHTQEAGEPMLTDPAPAEPAPADFFDKYPAYLRSSNDYLMENIEYRIDAVQGAEDFDNPGGEIQAVSKLLYRIKSGVTFPQTVFEGPILVYEGGPGHFSAWLIRMLNGNLQAPLVLAGRNILALEAAKHNSQAAFSANGIEAPDVRIIPSADLLLDCGSIKKTINPEGYSMIAVFPQIVPMTDRLESIWEGLTKTLAPGGLALIGLPSTDAERFDRKKPQLFTRCSDIRRSGFRAMGFLRTDTEK